MTAVPALDVFRCPLGGSRLVEASAGTGKTWAICGLVLRLLLERGLELPQILVVTFTKAATAELRDRLRRRLVEVRERLRGAPPSAADPFVDTLLAVLRDDHGLDDALLQRRLELALQIFDEAAIFTIHGFCQRALADAAFSAQAPLALELLEQDDDLVLEVVHDFWRRRIAGGTLPARLPPYLLAAGDTPERWAGTLRRRLARPLATLRWPAAIDAPFPADAELGAAHAAARTLWLQARDEVVQTLLAALPRLNAGTYKPDATTLAARAWDTLLATDDPLQALDKTAGRPDLFSAATLRDRAKKNQIPPTHAFFDLAERLLALRARHDRALALARLRLLRDLLDEGPAALRAAKRARRVQSFDDLLFELHARLAGAGGPALAAWLRARFPAALIDEFQDTDPLQYGIFERLYAGSGAPLFLVGDPKQAIYGFRQADLHTYLRARDQATAEYTLADNQRSSRELVAALNAFFGANPRVFMQPGLDYRPVDFGARPRTPFVDASAPRAALQLWQLPADGAGGSPLPKADARRAAAGAVAGEIARLLAAAQCGEVRLGERALAAGDIAVLVRTHAHGRVMRQALAALGVGSVELSQSSVFHGDEATELALVLMAILEPARERRLRAALATGLMGFDAAALHALQAEDADWAARVGRFAGYREQWLQRGIGIALRQWRVGERVDERLLAAADGERRLTNLLHLGELLHEAAHELAAPEALLRWLQARGADERGSEAAQLRLESDRNLVQIVTVHKSKGLEYPLVFCPLLWDGRLPRPDRKADGLALRDADGSAVIDFRAGVDEAFDADGARAQAQREEAAEFLRLIYVALTRAVHRCTLVVGRYTTAHGSSTSDKEGTHALLNWLAAGAGMAPDAWPAHTLAPAEVDAAWSALAERAAQAMALSPLPQDAVPALPAAAVDGPVLCALEPPSPLPQPWRIGSYSSLAHGARHEGAAVDHDLRVPAEADAAAEDAPATADDDILRFPRGPAAGDALHAVFERIAFDDPAGWPAAIDDALRALPQAPPEAPSQVLRMLADVLHTPLPGGFRLDSVAPARCLRELEFMLPAPRLGAAALTALLRAHGVAVPVLAFGTLQGYLRGFIDLVFEHGGRVYVLDWKSNHLGDTPADYAAPALARTMAEQNYGLQALLYAAAVHRALQQRQHGYGYETHFGGVLYLFVRGVRPHWRDADGRPTGVHFERPPLALIESLSALLAGAGASA